MILLAACAGEPDETKQPTPRDTAEGPGSELPAVEVSVHPEVTTVLVVSWEQQVDEAEAWVTWEGGSSPVRAAPLGHNEVVVLGLPASTAVALELHLNQGGAERIVPLAGTTGALPIDLQEPALLVREEGSFRPEQWLLTSVDVGPTPFFGPCYTVILDDAGRIVWYRPTSDSRLTWAARPSLDGRTLLADESAVYVFTGARPSIARFTLDLAVEEVVGVDDLFLSFSELPDGSFLYDRTRSPFEFDLARRDAGGAPESLWECYPWMADHSEAFWGCATNAVNWSEERGSVLWSMFETNTVVELDAETGEILAEYGEYPGGWTFDPPTSAFEKQHWPSWTADGHLLVSTHTLDDRRQVARKYALDPATQTLREVWSAEAPAFAEYAGQIQELPSGNYLWQLGVTGIVLEMRPDGAVVWQIQWPDHLVGNVTPLADLYAFTVGAG